MSAFAYDENNMSDPVSRYDFVPKVKFSGKNSPGKFYKWVNSGIPKEWKGHLYFDECPICMSKRDQTTEVLSFEYLKYDLSNYLESKKETIDYLIIWDKGEIEFEFEVKSGNKQATDDDGIIYAKLNAENAEFELIGSTTFNAKIGQNITIKLKVKDIVPYTQDGSVSAKSKDIFKAPSIEFYAYDDTSSLFDFKGNISEHILVGKFAILPWSCVNNNWNKVDPFIDVSDFVPYTTDCLLAARLQIKKQEYKTASDGYSEDYAYAFLIYKDKNGRVTNSTSSDVPQKPIIFNEAFIKGIEYLKESIPNSIPVIVGVDHSQKSSSYPTNGGDGTSDHFVVLVGMGKNTSRTHGNESICYFYLFDNAVSNGYSTDNKIYSNCIENRLTAAATNSFIRRTDYKRYYVTQIRKSVKI